MPFPVSLMPFPIPPLINIAVKILFQLERLENCLTFELAKYNLVIFWLYNTIVFCKLQNVNIILLGAFPNATSAFSDTSIVYYSSKRYMYHQTLLKNCLTFYLAKCTVGLPDATNAFSDTSIVYYSSKRNMCHQTLLKNCLTFYLAKYTVDSSALQHYCFPQL